MTFSGFPRIIYQVLVFLIYFLTEAYMLYRIFLFSVKPQHESAIGIHMSPPFWNSLYLPPQPSPLGWQRAPVWVPWVTQQIPIGCLCYIWWWKFPCYSLCTPLQLTNLKFVYSFFKEPVKVVIKNPPPNAGDVRNFVSIPVWGRYPGGGHGNPLQYSCLENTMDTGAWWATGHGIAKSPAWLKRLSTHACSRCISV